MSLDMTRGDTGWPTDHTWRPCRICYGPTPRQPQDGCCDECNGLEPEAKPRPVVDYLPIAIVYPGRKVSVRQRAPYTYWARGEEWASGRGRSLLLAHAHRYARITGGRVEVL